MDEVAEKAKLAILARLTGWVDMSVKALTDRSLPIRSCVMYVLYRYDFFDFERDAVHTLMFKILDKLFDIVLLPLEIVHTPEGPIFSFAEA